MGRAQDNAAIEVAPEARVLFLLDRHEHMPGLVILAGGALGSLAPFYLVELFLAQAVVACAWSSARLALSWRRSALAVSDVIHPSAMMAAAKAPVPMAVQAPESSMGESLGLAALPGVEARSTLCKATCRGRLASSAGRDTRTVASGIIDNGDLIYVWSYGPPFGGGANPSFVGRREIMSIKYVDEAPADAATTES